MSRGWRARPGRGSVEPDASITRGLPITVHDEEVVTQRVPNERSQGRGPRSRRTPIRSAGVDTALGGLRQPRAQID